VKFDDFVREKFKNIGIPISENVFGVYIEKGDDGLRFAPWKQMVSEFTYDPEVPYFAMLVPTRDTVTYKYMVEHLLDIEKPVFITGDTGVGKSVILQDFINNNQEAKELTPIFMNFSAQTNAKRTQLTIESKLEKKRKDRLGARGNNKR